MGSLDLGAALTGGEVRFQPGLLAAADGGVLYVDEVNLLADHLVDALLDAAASGVNRVERDGVSHSHPARFLLVGSMNPEEGDLRPQLLDRFGLAVDVRNPTDPATRAEVVRRRQGVRRRPVRLRRHLGRRPRTSSSPGWPAPAPPPSTTTCWRRPAPSAWPRGRRACGPTSSWPGPRPPTPGGTGRTTTTADDVRAVAHLVLAHRQRRQPLDDPAASSAAVDDALDDALGDGALGPEQPSDDHVAAPDPPAPVIAIVAPKSEETGRMGRRSPVERHRPGPHRRQPGPRRRHRRGRRRADDPGRGRPPGRGGRDRRPSHPGHRGRRPAGAGQGRPHRQSPRPGRRRLRLHGHRRPHGRGQRRPPRPARRRLPAPRPGRPRHLRRQGRGGGPPTHGQRGGGPGPARIPRHRRRDPAGRGHQGRHRPRPPLGHAQPPPAARRRHRRPGHQRRRRRTKTR